MNGSDDLSELLRESRAIKAQAESATRRVEERHQLYLNRLAGELADRAKEDRSEAEKCLSHAERNVRIVGLDALLNVWQANDGPFRTRCEHILLHDPDEQVRAVALNCLAKCYESTNDQRVACLFAGFVRDEAQSKEIRIAAYFGLLIVNGDFQRRPELILDFSFPEDVDWPYVDRIR